MFNKILLILLTACAIYGNAGSTMKEMLEPDHTQCFKNELGSGYIFFYSGVCQITYDVNTNEAFIAPYNGVFKTLPLEHRSTKSDSDGTIHHHGAVFLVDGNPYGLCASTFFDPLGKVSMQCLNFTDGKQALNPNSFGFNAYLKKLDEQFIQNSGVNGADKQKLLNFIKSTE